MASRANSSADDGPPVGIRPALGQRRPPSPQRIAARLQRHAGLQQYAIPVTAESVMRLNPGFFALEDLRARRGPKIRRKS